MLHLVGLLYDAGLNDDRWPVFVQALADAVGSDSAFVRLGQQDPGGIELVASHGYDPRFIEAYRDYYHRLDHYRPFFFGSIEIGRMVTGDYAIPNAERFKTEYYNDYERPQDKHHCAGGVVARENGRALVMAVQRGRLRSAFDGREISLLDRLSPHVARAFQIRRQLRGIEAERRAAHEALDRLPVAVLLLDAHARPVFVNRKAEELLRQSRILRMENGVVAGLSSGDTAALRRLVAKAAHTAAGKGMGSGGMHQLGARTPNALNALVTPLSGRFAAGQTGACAAMFVAPAKARASLPLEMLVQLHGLTAAEARLAAGLVEGASLEELAERFAITRNTARAQLKAVFRKTNTNRQGELIAVLLGGPLAACYSGASEADVQPGRKK